MYREDNNNQNNNQAMTEALHRAIRRNDINAVETLLEGGADVNGVDADRFTALHLAALYGHADIVGLLLEGGADANAVDGLGDTPLRYAAHGHADMARLLLDSGANINAVDRDGYTPLHRAVSHRYPDIVRLLLDRDPRPNVNAVDRDGHTALHEAVINGRADIAQLLLEGGADVNAVNLHVGYTALHHAVRNGRADMVALLLGAGANVNAENGGGYTPITLALEAAQMSHTEWNTIVDNIREGNIGDMDAMGYPGVVANLVEAEADLEKGSPPWSYVVRLVKEELRDLLFQINNQNGPFLFK